MVYIEQGGQKEGSRHFAVHPDVRQIKGFRAVPVLADTNTPETSGGCGARLPHGHDIYSLGVCPVEIPTWKLL